MVFKVLKNDRVSYLSGTAHFFPYSFKKSLTEIISKVDTVLFEGPLNESDMETIASHGYENTVTNPFIDLLTEKARTLLSQEFEVSDSDIYRYIGYVCRSKKSKLEEEIQGLKPWMAFFKIWTFYLRKRGWVYSVDMEAHSVAKAQKKEIHYLETIEEQVRALEDIPIERIVNFLNLCPRWETLAKSHAKLYLEGDLEALLGSTTSFPTRCASIIDRRDPVLFERSLPFFKRGNVAVFVGITHIKGISERLKNLGYKVSQGL